MSMADIAACSKFSYPQPSFPNQMRGPVWPSVKRNVDTNQDVETSCAVPKIRRTAVMHSVHDVGTAMHSLSLSTNPTSMENSNVAMNCTSTPGASRGSHTDSAECEPNLIHADSDRNSYFQPGDSLVGDEDDAFCNTGQPSDQGMLMDSAMFADRVSACSRITVAENSILSVSKVLSSGSKSFFDDRVSGLGDGGALIIYRYFRGTLL